MRYNKFAHKAKRYPGLLSEWPDHPDVRRTYLTSKSLSDMIDFSRFLALPTAPRTHTVSFAKKLCNCLYYNDHTSVMRLLSKNTRLDVTIKCHGRVYHVNRNMVCRKSSFFDRAMNGYFKESITGMIELPDDDPDILEYFLEFLYRGNYTNGVKKCGSCRKRHEELREALESWSLMTDDKSLSDFPEIDDAKGAYKPVGLDNRYPGKNIKDSRKWREKGFDEDLKEYLRLPKTHEGNPSFSITLHLRLYIMAVKYDVKPLARIARERFITAFGSYKWKYMPQVTDELYQNTLSTADRVIREAAIEALVRKMYEYKGMLLVFQPVMLKHSDFADDIWQEFFLPSYDRRARVKAIRRPALRFDDCELWF